MSLGVLEPVGFAAGVMIEEQRHEGPERFGRVALSPVLGVEHVSHFWSPNSANHADDAGSGWFGGSGGGRGQEFDAKVPAIGAVVAALDPFFRLLDVVGGSKGCMLHHVRIRAHQDNICRIFHDQGPEEQPLGPSRDLWVDNYHLRQRLDTN